MAESTNALTLPAELSKKSAEESIAQSIIPYSYDDHRARYLGLRSCGFTTVEAIRLLDLAKSTLSRWRAEDAEFCALEKRIPEFRAKLSKEFISTEFARNFCMVLKVDSQVLLKHLKGEELSLKEHQYMLKMRANYTPQQMQIVEALLSGSGGSGELDWTTLVKEATKMQRDMVQVTASRTLISKDAG